MLILIWYYFYKLKKNKKEKETRKSQKADYNRKLEQMLDDRSTGKVESKDTNNFKY